MCFFSLRPLFLLDHKRYLIYFDGGIPDYQLTRKLNPDKTFETPELSGLTRSDCIHLFYARFR